MSGDRWLEPAEFDHSDWHDDDCLQQLEAA